jgi:hypothetical protein
MKYNIIFDLDSVVTVPLQTKSEEEHNIAQAVRVFGKEMADDLTMTAYNYKHLIFPGVYALWEWLHTEGMNIIVFSSAIRERNEELVPKLVERAFRNWKKEDHPEVKIFSREHLVETTRMIREEGEKYQPVFYGQCKKKLSDIVVPPEELPYSLLIEDDKSYMTKGEEKNLIKVPSSFGFIPFYERERGIRILHKPYYMCGLLDKIRKTAHEKNMTPADAAKYIQVDLEGEEFRRNFHYPGTEKIEYHNQGLEILKKFDSSLKFFPIPEREV